MTDVVGSSLGEVSTGNYKLKVHNYSKLDKTVGASISSPTISLLGRHWKLKIYIGGYKKESKEYISIFLHHVQGSKVKASVAFTLVDQVNKSPHSTTCTTNKSTFGQNVFARSNTGYKQFVKQSLLNDANSRFIVNDTAIFRVEIKISNNANSSDLEAIYATESKAEPILSHLFESGLGSDVNVVLLDTESQVSDRIPAHKCILMARSPVFKAMFTHNMSERNTNEIVISDFSSEVIKEMLHFMYTEKLQSRSLDNSVHEGLLGAAIKYDVSDLAKLCEVHLFAQLSDSNVLDLVRLANVTGSVTLKQKCISYVKNNAERLLKNRNTEALLGSFLDTLVSGSVVGRKRKLSDCESDDTASDDSSSSSSGSGSSSGGAGVSDNNECVVM